MKFLKNIHRNVKLTLLLLLSSISLMAENEVPSITLKNDMGKSFEVYLDYPHRKDFKLALRDQEGKVLWQEKVWNQRKYSKKINLKNLPDGAYFLETEDDHRVTICPIKIKDDSVTTYPEQSKSIIRPRLEKTEDIVTLHIANKQATDIGIFISDDDRAVLYEEEIKEVKFLKKMFTFEKSLPGYYTFQIYVDGRAFQLDVKI